MTIVFQNTIPWPDLLGFVVGHVYYFLEDVLPGQSGGFRVLKTPGWFKELLQPGEGVVLAPIVDLNIDEIVQR